MNELIKEFALKAGATLIQDSEWGTDFNYDKFDLELFSKLMTEECLEVVEKQFGGGNGDGVEWDRAVDFTYNDVKEHFGVEA